MSHLTCLPSDVRQSLEGCRLQFNYEHFWTFCWLLTLHIFCSGKSNLKELSRHGPITRAYHHYRRLLLAGYWLTSELLNWFVWQVISSLEGDENGLLFIIVDSTIKDKRSKKNPLAKKGKKKSTAPYLFGLHIIFIMFHWQNYRIPVSFALIRKKDHPDYQNENALACELLGELVLPQWAKQVVVLADCAYASKSNLTFIQQKGWFYVMGVAKTWNFDNGKSLKNFVRHTRHDRYHRVWFKSLKGKSRRTYYTYLKRVHLKHLGEVTLVLSKKRRNHGPKSTKVLVTNLPNVTARKVVAYYQKRWFVEILIWELKGGLGLGEHQVTKDERRVVNSVGISVLAYLLLLKLRHQQIPKEGSWSIFELKRLFWLDTMEEQLERSVNMRAKKWLKEMIAA